MRFSLYALLVSLLFVAPGFGAVDELPRSDETFPAYFVRITRGGHFPGIRLNAPEKFQTEFFKTIRKGYWVGGVNAERKRLEAAGVNLWFDWYSTKKPLKILETLAAKSFPGFSERLREETLRDCAGPVAVSPLWSETPLCVRAALTKVLLFHWKDGQGKTLIDRVAQSYGLTSADITGSVDIFLENATGFARKVCEMGYCGTIYFRGITGPNPRDKSRHWIVMNHDLMAQMTPFDRPFLQMLEYAGILSHEINHVAQDEAGKKLGLDIQVRSAEAALLIEGMAEHLNQEAWLGFSRNLPPANPFALFTREQGAEIAYREGNEVAGNLFPYTVGLPFMEAFFSMRARENVPSTKSREEILRELGAVVRLEEVLSR
jgi:hypothetical protein